MATLVTAASVRNAASSLMPRRVVGNFFLVTVTSLPDSQIRVAATTLSRCTSRPAALSACCFTSHLLPSSNHTHLRWPLWERTTVKADSGVRARSDTRWSPRPRVRLKSRTWLQAKVGDHTQRPPSGFHSSQVAAPVMTTQTIPKALPGALWGANGRRSEWCGRPGYPHAGPVSPFCDSLLYVDPCSKFHAASEGLGGLAVKPRCNRTR